MGRDRSAAATRRESSTDPSSPLLAHETLYVGIDVGKLQHVAGFVSQSLLARHQRFESCPALSFANSREGFRSLGDRLQTYVPLTQVDALLEVTGHYHKALVQYLHELDIPVYLMHVQKRQAGLLKSDKRDALGLVSGMKWRSRTAPEWCAIQLCHFMPDTSRRNWWG